MKKIIALLIGLFMVLTLGGCSSSSTNENPIDPNAHDEHEVKTLADDTSLRALVVNVPENFETVARFVESTADGKIIEKDLNYTMTDGPDIGYALMCNANLADSIGTSNLEAMEKLDVDGRTVYIYKDGSTYMALAECGNDIYAVNYALKDDKGEKDGALGPDQVACEDLTRPTPTICPACASLRVYRYDGGTFRC